MARPASNSYAVKADGSERVSSPQLAKASHQALPTTTGHAAPPPKGPRAWHEDQKATACPSHSFKPTAWSEYPEGPKSSEMTASSTRADSCTPVLQTRQLLPDPLLTYLTIQLEHLKFQACSIAETYRNFGLLFHSFSGPVLWHPKIDPEIRRFARINFLAGAEFPLPDIVHVIGTLQYTLTQAEKVLHRSSASGLLEKDFKAIRAHLCLAERLLAESMPQLDMLRQAVEIFCRTRAILGMEGKSAGDGGKRYHERMRRYQAWAHGLPLICWEGCSGNEV